MIKKRNIVITGTPGIDTITIAKELNFGEPTIEVNGEKKENPYAKVKPEYVFFYRQKFKLPLRKKASFAKTTDSKRDVFCLRIVRVSRSGLRGTGHGFKKASRIVMVPSQ